MASKKLTLPSGATVELRDPTTLRVKDRKQVYRAASGEEGIMQALSLVDGLIAVLIQSWSFELIIPSIRIQSLDELEMPDYDLLAAEATDAQKILFPSVTKTEASLADAESPFAESSD